MIHGYLDVLIQHRLQTVSVEAFHDHQTVLRPGNDLQHPHNILMLQVQHVGLVPQRIVPTLVLLVLLQDLDRHRSGFVACLDDHPVAAPAKDGVPIRATATSAATLRILIPQESLPVRRVKVDLDLRDG